jgi:hypothetical protein
MMIDVPFVRANNFEKVNTNYFAIILVIDESYYFAF